MLKPYIIKNKNYKGMESKEKEGHAQKLLNDLGKKIDDVIKKLKNTSEDVQKEFSGTVEDMKKIRDDLDREFSKFREENKDKFKEAEVHIKNASNELRKAIESIFIKK